MDHFYRNAQAYETWWAHEGSGTLKSQFGNLKFRKGDYIVIPFGTTWQMHIDGKEARFFTIENPSQIEPPRRYRNQFGQMLEPLRHALVEAARLFRRADRDAGGRPGEPGRLPGAPGLAGATEIRDPLVGAHL